MLNVIFRHYACNGYKRITYSIDSINLAKIKMLISEKVFTAILHENCHLALSGSLIDPGNNVRYELQLTRKIFKKLFSRPLKKYLLTLLTIAAPITARQ